jgi:hypothetical protein
VWAVAIIVVRPAGTDSIEGTNIVGCTGVVGVGGDPVEEA